MMVGVCNHSIGDKPTLRELICLKYTNERGEEHKIHIINTVAVRWRTLGPLLNFELSDLDNIRRNNTDVEDCCQELLSRWLRGAVGGPVTWERLLEAMEDARCGEVAQQVKKVLSDEGR